MSNVTPPNEERIALEDIAVCRREGRPLRPAHRYQIQVVDSSMQGSLIEIDDPIPTGRQILEAAGRIPVDRHILILIEAAGSLEEVNLSETVDVYHRGVEQFVVFESDRLFYFALNGQRLPWGSSNIQENALRKIGCIPENHSIWLERQSKEDRMIAEGECIDLIDPALEKLYTKPKSWQLNVQGVLVISDHPTILASDALNAAGFNPDKGWILILKVKGEPKQSIGLDDHIDLRKPGIEKLRLIPAEINNGDAVATSSMAFALLDKDRAYLNALDIEWKTVLDGGRRWLIIRNYILPSGYNHEHTTIAIEIPTTYPGAAIDMFYVYPALTLANGGKIEQTQSTVNIVGTTYQRWSRHLNGATRWNPLTDCVVTHLAVIEESLLREVGE
ncbi:MAG: hypothetical protein GXP08_00920 [Gammaproteobacteria bacterium]|nr:hypothetical protein [Gammaproteobacteria bacterium]